MTLLLSAALGALWVVLLVLFAAAGSLMLGPPDPDEAPWSYAHLAFWAGVATLTGVLLAWHLVLPVDTLATGALAIAAAGGLWRHRRTWAACLRTISWPGAAAIFALLIWIGNHALNAAGADDFNYEFQATRWIHDFPIVPGLANLHGRLGFNQAHHLLSALLSVGPLAGRVNHVLNGVFEIAIVTYTLGGLLALSRRTASTRSERLRALLVGPAMAPILFGTFGPIVSTLKADAIVSSAVVLLACLVAEVAETRPGSRKEAQRLAVLLLVAAFAAAVKLNATAFCIVLYLGVCWRLWHTRRLRPRLAAPVRVALGLSLAVGVLVPVRSVLLSGYPVYPSTVAGFPVDWRVSPAQAVAERTFIWSFAVLRSTYIPRPEGPGAWIPWWARWTVLWEKYSLVLPLLLGLMALGFWLASPRASRRTTRDAALWMYATLWAASAAAIYIWLTEAPAGRFASAYVWIAAGGAVLWCRERVTGLRWSALLAASVAALPVLVPILTWVPIDEADRPGFVVLGIAALIWLGLWLRAPERRAWVFALGFALGLCEPAGRAAAALVHHRYDEVADMVWLRPSRRDKEEDPDPAVARVTRSGLLVYEAGRIGYQTALPNTRFFNPYLEQRQPGVAGSGFRVRLPADVIGPGYSLARRPRSSGRP